MESSLRTERFGVSVEAWESSSTREPIGRVGAAELWLLAASGLCAVLVKYRAL